MEHNTEPFHFNGGSEDDLMKKFDEYLNAPLDTESKKQVEADQVQTPSSTDSVEELVAQTMEARSEAACRMIDARRALLDATLNLNDANARYEDAKRDAYLMGNVTGKNAEERDARLASLLEVQIHNVRRAEAEWLKAKVEVECATDTVHGMDAIDALMKNALDQ